MWTVYGQKRTGDAESRVMINGLMKNEVVRCNCDFVENQVFYLLLVTTDHFNYFLLYTLDICFYIAHIYIGIIPLDFVL